MGIAVMDGTSVIPTESYCGTVAIDHRQLFEDVAFRIGYPGAVPQESSRCGAPFTTSTSPTTKTCRCACHVRQSLLFTCHGCFPGLPPYLIENGIEVREADHLPFESRHWMLYGDKLRECQRYLAVGRQPAPPTTGCINSSRSASTPLVRSERHQWVSNTFWEKRFVHL